MSLLLVENLKVHFPVRRGLLAPATESVKAVDGVSFTIENGETVGLVGESGCGKSSLGRAIVRLIPPTEGRVVFEGVDMARAEGPELREKRRALQFIFQDPYGSLDPRMTVAEILDEPFQIHGLPAGKEGRPSVQELLHAVGLDHSHRHRYPHEFSGGQRQRIGIARALALRPRLIICDEPVSALDVSVQAQIVNLLQDLQAQHEIAYLFIAHDLAVVKHISDRVLVMYLGRIVEAASPDAITQTPHHPYTQALISAIPRLDPPEESQRLLPKGDVPSPIHPPGGCPYHPRCPLAQEICRTDPPHLREVRSNHWAACHFAGETG